VDEDDDEDDDEDEEEEEEEEEDPLSFAPLIWSVSFWISFSVLSLDRPLKPPESRCQS